MEYPSAFPHPPSASLNPSLSTRPAATTTALAAAETTEPGIMASSRPRATLPDGGRTTEREETIESHGARPPRGRGSGVLTADLRRQDASTPVPQYLSGADIDDIIGIPDPADKALRSPPGNRWRARSRSDELARYPAGPNQTPPGESEPFSVIVLRDCILTPFLQGFLLGMLGHLHTFVIVRKPLHLLFSAIADLAKRPFKKREKEFAD